MKSKINNRGQNQIKSRIQNRNHTQDQGQGREKRNVIKNNILYNS